MLTKWKDILVVVFLSTLFLTATTACTHCCYEKRAVIKRGVGKEVLRELLPVWNRLYDLPVLLESTPQATVQIDDLKKKITDTLSELDEEMYQLDKEYGSNRSELKKQAANIRKKYVEKERMYRKEVVKILGRDDLPDVAVPKLTSLKKQRLYQEYLKMARDKNPVKRAEGVRGIGAIGEKAGIKFLLKSLSDPSENVKINAITSLAWLQAKEAVPLLSKMLLESKSKWIKRRCAQALGQIGDTQAIPLLMRYIRAKDIELAKISILGLGWLKATQAVPELITILGEKRPFLPVQRKQFADTNYSPPSKLSCCAAIALGYIGDKRAIKPLLDEYSASVQGIVGGSLTGHGTTRARGLEKYQMPLRKACALALGMIGDSDVISSINTSGKSPYSIKNFNYSKYAVEMIKEGRKELPPGIKQPEFSAQPSFFDFGKNSFLRIFNGYQFPVYRLFKVVSGDKTKKNEPVDFPYLYRLAASTGANMWRVEQSQLPVDSLHLLRERMKYMASKGVKIQMSFIGENKSDFVRTMAYFGDLPAWQGIEQEELEGDLTRRWYTHKGFESRWDNSKKYTREELLKRGSVHTDEWHKEKGKKIDKQLQKYLASKYTKKELKEMGVDLNRIHLMSLNGGHTYTKKLSPVLFTEYCDMRDEAFLEKFKELAQFTHMLRRGTDCRYAFSQTYASGYPGRFWELSDVVNGCGPENGSYSNIDMITSFWAELGRNSEPRSSYTFSWLGLSRGRKASSEMYVDKGMAEGLAHTQGTMAWGMSMFYPWANCLGSMPGKYYRNHKLDVISHYFNLAKKVEPCLASTRIATPVALLFSERTGRSPLYCNINPFGYKNKYSNTQTDIWKKLFKAHTPAEPVIVETIAGKESESQNYKSKLNPYSVCILASGKVLTMEEEERVRNFVKEGGVLIADASTTRYDRWGREMTDYGLSDVFGVSFQREEQYIDGGRIKTQSEILQLPVPQSLKKTLLSSNNDKANYDFVKNISGEVVGSFDNGAPGIILNRFGKGLSIFFTGNLSNLDVSGWKDCVEFALKFPGCALQKTTKPVFLVEVEKCPDEVEVVPRVQPETGRIIIHFVNQSGINSSGIKFKLNLPKRDIGRIYYPGDGKNIKPVIEEGKTTVYVRDFKTHEMIVVERNKKKESQFTPDIRK